jgi:crotonobetainyl-CoA:carnitine CoA-transferase CaiB-like acyl-CoA transferase
VRDEWSEDGMLEGLRIIEIEGLGPAPFAAMLLADLGADVIVVHRKNGRPAPGMPERSLIDRGKRSIELDLKSVDDVTVLKSLVRRSEALIEGFRPGVMERLGLGPDDLSRTNPDLVYGRMTGWGQTGPRAQTAGHDLNYISLSVLRGTPATRVNRRSRRRRWLEISAAARSIWWPVSLQASWPRAPDAAARWSMPPLSTGLPT